MKYNFTHILILLVILTPGYLHAESVFRCGNETAKIGETKYEVLIRCGEPDYRDFSVGHPYRSQLYFETWYYDCGTDRFLKILLFRNSRLFHIETGGYGSHRGLPCPSSSEWKTRKELLDR